ncbi:RidA family protein [Acidisoma cellulosilytica]|uniref:RidA family protein n=1 Tax=Acidisoma cellulosilyticum TaxID=2802395 RepID=A0A964E4Q8_9PROT|nr:RidA family protein [Acidisoma cellulosilyticum]MCB8881627.1 RidA family protein [Acidisoma cellulosilyticum]
MTNANAPFFLPDTDEDAISSDVSGIGNLLVTTQVPMHADGSMGLDGDITAQSELTLMSLKTSLEKCGSSLEDVIHLTIYMTDMEDRPAFNEVYCRFFAKPYPVRCAVGVSALADPAMRVEVTAMAVRRG